MYAATLLTGTRIEVGRIASDPRLQAAEAALARFERTGAVRDASAYARACLSLVHELVQQEFPRELQGEALRVAAIKVIDAYTSVGLSDDPGWLAWALAHELRDLAAAYGIPVEPLRPTRRTGADLRARAALSLERLHTISTEVLRIAGSTTALDEIQQGLGLSSAETARIFGVSRQAVDQWRQSGVPSDRLADVERVRDVARVLYDELLPDRIPQVVRNPARGLGNRSILDVLAESDGSERVRAYLARLYAFVGA